MRFLAALLALVMVVASLFIGMIGLFGISTIWVSKVPTGQGIFDFGMGLTLLCVSAVIWQLMRHLRAHYARPPVVLSHGPTAVLGAALLFLFPFWGLSFLEIIIHVFPRTLGGDLMKVLFCAGVWAIFIFPVMRWWNRRHRA